MTLEPGTYVTRREACGIVVRHLMKNKVLILAAGWRGRTNAGLPATASAHRSTMSEFDYDAFTQQLKVKLAEDKHQTKRDTTSSLLETPLTR